MSDKIQVTIDDEVIDVDPGTLVIRAAEQSGVRIPRFCDHPLLAPVAACRQCLVEIGTPDREGNLRMMPKPQPACAMTVSPGMVVKTQYTSEVAETAQKGVMEFLLINHPLDCPICDKGGECPLQNQAMSEGRDTSRFRDAKRVYPKPMRLTSQIMLDRDRCILCQRCVRFGKEIPGDAFIDLMGRGGGTAPTDDHSFVGEQIGAFDAEVLGFHYEGAAGPKRTDISGPYGQEGILSSVYAGPLRESEKDLSGRAFASYFSGNVIQICPVGALTASSYRFRARPFDLISVPSVTEHDASGSEIRVDVRRGEVVRRLSGNDPQVNEEWITDKDRFAFHWPKADRLKTPLVRENGELVPTSWSDALDRVARHLQSAAGSVGLLPGGRLTFEDAWAWSKFARSVLHTDNIDARWRESSGEETQFLLSEVAGQGLGVTYRDLESASKVLLVSLEPEDECGALFLRLRKAKVPVATVGPLLSRGSEKLAAELIPARPGEETTVLSQLETLPEGAVILVGERGARTPGLLMAVSALARRDGARLAWVPRRSGERAALEAGLLPGVLPFGRSLDSTDAASWQTLGWGPEAPQVGLSAAEMIDAEHMDTMIVGGIDLRDWPDPVAAKKAIGSAGFVISLEVTRTAVSDLADVVLPVAPASEKNGTFINWEGRLRPFGQAIASRSLTDRQVLARLAKEMGVDLGLETLEDLYAEVNPLMAWDRAGSPNTVQPVAGVSEDGNADAGLSEDGYRLAFHKASIDLGRLNTGADDLARSARRPVAFAASETLARLGVSEDELVNIEGPRGSVTLPIEIAAAPAGVIWVPECSFGNGVHAELGEYGAALTVSATTEVVK